MPQVPDPRRLAVAVPVPVAAVVAVVGAVVVVVVVVVVAVAAAAAVAAAVVFVAVVAVAVFDDGRRTSAKHDVVSQIYQCFLGSLEICFAEPSAPQKRNVGCV